MQLDQNTLIIILAVVVLVILLIVIANVRRKPRAAALTPRTAERVPLERDPLERDPLTTTGDASVEIRLSRLADLRSKGLMTEEEFDAQRKKMLGEL